MKYKYVVYVYNKKDSIFNDDSSDGLWFEFKKSEEAIKFVSDMVGNHNKAAVIFAEAAE